ncbi:MAG: hypothetical protein WBQ60_05600 [Asticcacaulis sp.]
MATSNNSTASGYSAGVLTVLAIIVVAIAAIGAFYLMQDNRSGAERAGDAIEALPNGVDKAADKLGDQSPAENVERNLGDAADKAADKVN